MPAFSHLFLKIVLPTKQTVERLLQKDQGMGRLKKTWRLLSERNIREPGWRLSFWEHCHQVCPRAGLVVTSLQPPRYTRQSSHTRNLFLLRWPPLAGHTSSLFQGLNRSTVTSSHCPGESFPSLLHCTDPRTKHRCIGQVMPRPHRPIL